MHNGWMGKKLGQVIVKARAAKNRMTQGHLAQAMGVTRSAVGQWETGRTTPTPETLIQLCAYFGIDLTKATAGILEFIEKTDDNATVPPIITAKPEVAGAPRSTEIRLTPDDIQSMAAMPADVPVRGVAVGGNDGYFLLNGEIIDYVRRPAGIAKSKDVFAIYVVGSSMSPRYEEGDPVYLASGRVPKIGDYVVVEVGGTDGVNKAYIKRLAKRSPSVITLEQFNPPLTFEVRTSEIASMFRVIPWSEVLGI